MDLNIKQIVSTAAEAVTMMLQTEVEDHKTRTKRDWPLHISCEP